jgi:serine/threonine protein kinase
MLIEEINNEVDDDTDEDDNDDEDDVKSIDSRHRTSFFKNGQYETIKKLGSGSFGTVFLVIDKLDNNSRFF